MGRYNHSFELLSATIMVSKNCPIIGEHIFIIFVTQEVTIVTVTEDGGGGGWVHVKAVRSRFKRH